MTKRMLIDAAHKEEVRVAVISEDKIEDFEVETAGKEQIKGNIYVAEVTRVEPSLQAAFVNYGGNRNGFLAFSEIHPAYFTLSDEEKQALLDELTEIANKRKGRDQEAEKRLEEELSKKEASRKNLEALEERDDAVKATDGENETTDEIEESSKDAKKETKGRGRGRRPSRKTKESAETPSEEPVDAPEETPEVSAKETHKTEDDKEEQASRKAVKDETPESLVGLTPEEMEEDAKALAIASNMIIDDQDAPIEMDEQSEDKPKRRGRPPRKPKRHTRKDEDEASHKATEKTDDTETTSSSEGEKSNKSSKKSLKDTKASNDADEDTLYNETDDDEENTNERRLPIHRRYNIADVIKEGQKILIQVNKEERGNKGAAVSTYISLPGRYSVLMPNTPYAGGISRKITDFSVRRKIKSIVGSLEVPEHMGVIIRTAGVNQEEDSIKKDVNNMLSLWKKIDIDFNSKKKAPYLVHEDGSLAVRAIRDMFNDEIEEVIVSDRKTYRATKDYMKSLMPESAKKVKEHKLQTPIFIHHDVEDKLNRLHTTRVNLPSGGYLIINPTEALVSIDVNSGKATQENNIEETALKTNLEAAEEVCRQLRLRDLAGLVVVDFIDMEENKNEKAVEKMMRKCVRKDRARIQIAQISQFGLLEMSRQRLRPSLGESTMQACKHCNGTGLVPSLATAALSLLRSLEDENIRTKAERVIVTTSDDLALYVLNHKRDLLKDIEERHGFDVYLRGDNKYHAPDHRIEIIHKDSRGNEKRQTIEVILREPMEDDDSKRSRRRGNKKKQGKQTENKHEGDKKHHKRDEKSDSKKNHHKNDKDAKSEDLNDAENKNSNEETTNKRERRSGGRVRHLRRGSRKRDDENGVETSENVEKVAQESSAKMENEEKSDKAHSEHKNKRRTRTRRNNRGERSERSENKIEKDGDKAPAKSEEKKSTGITVQTVSATGESSVSKADDGSVTKKFQRWWSKTTS